MAFSLGDWLKKRVDDVEGAFGVSNARQSFRTNVPKAAPARTVSTPGNKRQPASVARPLSTQEKADFTYGSGLSYFGNRFRDLVDANTEADRIRRQAQSGLNESYQQEQQRKTLEAQNDPRKRSTLEQVSGNALGGLSEFAKVPSQFAKMKGAFEQTPVGKAYTFANPFTAPSAIGDELYKRATGQDTAQKRNDLLYNVGSATEKTLDNKIQQSGLGNKQSDNKWIAGVSRGGGQLLGQAAAAAATGGSSLPSAAIGLQTASGEYDRARQAGKNNNQAVTTGLVQGTVSAGLEKVGFDKLGTSKTVLGSALKGFGTEGVQEGVQQLAQNLIANKMYDPRQGIKDGVLESAVMGGITGGLAGPLMGGYRRPSQPTTELAKPQSQDVRLRPNEAYTLSDYQDVLTGNVKQPSLQSQIIKDAYQVAKRTGIDLTSGSPADIQTRINDVLSQSQNNKRFFKPLNEGGYVQVPGKDIDPLESLKAEARKYKSAEEFVNSKTNAYHGSDNLFDEMQVGRPTKRRLMFGEYDTTSEGMFFAPDEKVAREFGENVGKYYVDVKKPLVFSDRANDNFFNEFDKSIENVKGIEIKPGESGFSEWMYLDGELGKRFKKFAKSKGFDGAKIDEVSEFTGDNFATTVAFENNQVKSTKQLTDLYNQAQKEAVVPVTEKKPRPNKRKIIEDAVWDKKIRESNDILKRYKDGKLTLDEAHRELGRGYAATDAMFEVEKLQGEATRQELRAQGMTVPDDYVQNKPTVTMDNLDRKRLKSDPQYQLEVNKSMFAVGQPTKEALMKEYKKVFGNYDEPKISTSTKPKNLVLSEAQTPGGQTVQKVMTGKGQVETRRNSPMTDQAYKEVFGTTPEEDAQAFDAVAAGSNSNSTRKLTEALNQSEVLTKAAAQAQQDGKEINFYAKKDKNGRSVGIERFDPRYNKIEAGFVTDPNGRVLGNHIKVDENGIQVNVGGDLVNLDKTIGNPSDWNGHYEISSTMERNIYKNAPDKATADATYNFVVANKIKNEAALRTELRQQRQRLNERSKAVMKAKPFGKSSSEYKADVFDLIEGNTSRAEFAAKYGENAASAANMYKTQTRQLYDSLLDRVNAVFEQYGEPTVAKRKDYITHINELIQRPSFAGELYGQLQNSFIGEGKTATRGEVPGNISGRTENFEPQKKWNRFFQQRKGGEFTKDPFKAVDAYLEPTLYNIHMTEPAVRARAVEAAFRTASEIKQTDTSKVSDTLSEQLDKYKFGKGNSSLVTGFQEFANALTGKTQRWDRQVIDSGKAPRLALHGWQKLQAISGRSTVLGNAMSVVSQTLNQPGAIAQAGPINYAKGVAQSITGGGDIKKSPFITARQTRVDSMFRSRTDKALDVGGVPMQVVEMAMIKQTWNGIHQKVLSEGYNGQRAIIETDRRTERVVAGRGIADKPELYRSTIANGVLQYTLEVNATNKQFWRDLSPSQKATFIVATSGLNLLVGAVTGFEPLPDFLKAALNGVGDFFDTADDRSGVSKAAGTVQGLAGEYASMNPIISAGANTFLSQDQRKALFGSNSDLGRFEGTSAPVKVVKSGFNAVKDLANQDYGQAATEASRVLPFGNQIRKTTTGAQTLARGYAVDSRGNRTFDAPTSVTGKAKTLVFGPSSTNEANTFYAGKNGISGTAKTAKQSDVKDILKAQFSDPAGRDFLSMNEAEKKAAAQVDPAVRSMYEEYKKVKRVNAADPLRPSGLSKESEDILNWNSKRTPQQRENIKNKQKDYEYKLLQAQYEEKKLKGMSKPDEINFLQRLSKAKAGTDFDKVTRDVYNKLSKAEILTYTENDPNGKAIYEQAVAYGDALVEAGVIKKNKLRTGSRGGKRGGRKGKKVDVSKLVPKNGAYTKGLQDLVDRAKLSSGSGTKKYTYKKAKLKGVRSV